MTNAAVYYSLLFLDVDLDASNTFIQEFMENPMLIDKKLVLFFKL